MDKGTKNIFFISGGAILLFGIIYLINSNKEQKGKGEVSDKTKKENKLVLIR